MSDSLEVNFKTGAITPNGIPIAPFFWLADTGACGHYRCAQPAQSLARQFDMQVEVGSTNSMPYSILVAQRTHKEDCVSELAKVKMLRNGQAIPKIVYELDDDLWSIEKDNPGYDYYTSNNVLDHAVRAIEISDAVIVSTEPLAQIVRQYNANVTVAPNSINRKYLNPLRYKYTTGSVNKPFVLGWSGSATHKEDFMQLVPALNVFLKFNPNTRMVFFGTDYSHLLDSSVHELCRTAPWTKTVGEYLELLSGAQIDVMLAPLAPTKFNESKSNLRIIEANALGIPVIATDFGPYGADFSPGSTLVQPGESWMQSLISMQSSSIARASMGAAGRMWVEANYVQEDNAKIWMSAFVDVLDA